LFFGALFVAGMNQVLSADGVLQAVLSFSFFQPCSATNQTTLFLRVYTSNKPKTEAIAPQLEEAARGLCDHWAREGTAARGPVCKVSSSSV
jgi:hypothetical protein